MCYLAKIRVILFIKGSSMKLYHSVVIVLILFLSGCTQTHKQVASLEDLNDFILDGQSKGYVPQTILTGLPTFAKKLQPVDLEHRTVITWDMNSRCTDSARKVVLALDHAKHSIVCDAGDVAYIAGDGDDWVEDAVGNDIFYMGGGDDTVKNSYGSDIFIFEKNWGHDSIEVNSERADTSAIEGYDGSYPWKYTSFIIFGKGIDRADIHWQENKLVHAETGDSITLNTRDVTILFADDETTKPIDKNFIPTKRVPKKISLDQLKGQSLTLVNETLFLADRGLALIDVHDIKNPLLLSKLDNFPGTPTSIKVVKEIAYVTQAAPYFSEGAGGWVSIVDIKEPQNPKILSTLNFGNNIFNVAIHGTYLYVADSHFSYGDQRQLSIFDISSPTHPKLISTLKLKYHARFMAYANEMLFLSTFKNKMSVIDVKHPQEPKVLAYDYRFEDKVMGMKTSHNTLIVNQNGGTVTLFETTPSQEIRHRCDIATDPVNRYASNSASSLAIQGNTLYLAQHQEGVRIINLQTCTLEKSVPFGGTSITSVGIVGDTLIAMNTEKIFLYDLNRAHLHDKKTVPVDPYANLSKDQLQTLLYKAALYDKEDDAVVLCKAGANPNFAGHERYTPVQISARVGSVRALEALLKNGGVADEESMMLAALTEKIEAMKLLEKYGGNIAQTDKNGCSTLHYIAQDGTQEMVRYLLEKGVPINATCRGKETPLTWANYGKNIEVIQYLQSRGAR